MARLMDLKWEEVSIEERKAVVEMYNKFYNDEDEPISFEQCEEHWFGARWITIKFTFGVEPYKA